MQTGQVLRLHLLLALKSFSTVKFARVRCFKQSWKEKQNKLTSSCLCRIEISSYENIAVWTCFTSHRFIRAFSGLENTDFKFLPIQKTISAKAVLVNHRLRRWDGSIFHNIQHAWTTEYRIHFWSERTVCSGLFWRAQPFSECHPNGGRVSRNTCYPSVFVQFLAIS